MQNNQEHGPHAPQFPEPDGLQKNEVEGVGTPEIEAALPTGSLVPPASEGGCPPPLEWQEILREFHAQADNWYLDRGDYRLAGRTMGSGPPLYLLNSFTGTHELYALLVWLLRDQYRCVMFDDCLAGARGRVTLDHLANDLLAVADTAGDRRFDVFAPSFGGLVAMTAMRSHSDRIGRALIQGGFAHRTLTRFERVLIRVCSRHPGRLRHLPLRGIIQQQNHRRWFPPFDKTRWRFLFDNTGAVPIAELARRAAIVRDSDLRPIVQEIRQPVRLVRTEGNGSILDRCCDELSAGLPNATEEFIDNTGQFPWLTHPHRLAKVIREFLEGGK